eukprot:2791389-Prymnesium_polylepis.1
MSAPVDVFRAWSLGLELAAVAAAIHALETRHVVGAPQLQFQPLRARLCLGLGSSQLRLCCLRCFFGRAEVTEGALVAAFSDLRLEPAALSNCAFGTRCVGVRHRPLWRRQRRVLA